MSLVRVVADYQREGEVSSAGGVYERRFKVEFDAPPASEETVLYAAGVPALFSKHPADPYTRLMRKRATLLESSGSRLHWAVICNYEVRPGTDPDADYDKPWDLPAEVSFTTARYQRVFEAAYGKLDVDNNMEPLNVAPAPFASGWRGAPRTVKIANTAGILFDPGLGQEEINTVILIRKAQMADDVSIPELLRFRWTINSSLITVGGIPLEAYQGRMNDIRLTPRRGSRDGNGGGGEKYWDVEYEVEVNERQYGHLAEVLSRGFMKTRDLISVPQGPEDVERILDGLNRPTAEPQLLDVEGKVTGVRPYWLKFALNIWCDWKTLELPIDEWGGV